MHFELLATDRESFARRTRFRTAHGVVDGPAFMPVGTLGAVKSMTPPQVADTGAQVMLANAFHMSLEERAERVARMGGLHKFTGWNRTILTDSGGFQVFSLPGTKIDESGATFRHGEDAQPIKMTPESSMEVQRQLGADIVMAFDECVEYPAEYGYLDRAVERTYRWAQRCLSVELAPHQYLFGIVQGGTFEKLRIRAAEQIASLPFDGFAIGGVSVGEGLDLLCSVVATTAPLLPENLPRYLMGVGLPEDILEAVERGIDMFDCVIPTRYARNGTLFTVEGKLRIGDKRYKKDRYPVDTSCDCYTCKNFSRLALRHFLYAGEAIYATLASIHNLHFYQHLMKRIRAAIEAGDFTAMKRDFLSRYKRQDDVPEMRNPRKKDRKGR
ncbi:MAG: tRNA guanosine(34) transglycosylase Tgt [Deltaproteobacteria bacterium]|nr:tRNA guanosine(34) transglycosylase Tgt [Deltaproteobacteria bacterium]